jgi:hypothetical protein
MKISDVLVSIGAATTGFGTNIPGTPGVVVTGVGSALTLVGDLLELGVDPSEHLEQLRDINPELRRIRAERAARKQNKLNR